MKLIIFLASLALVLSCSDNENSDVKTSGSESRQTLILGKWDFDSLEVFSADSINKASGSDYEGRSVEFVEGGQYYSMIRTEEGLDTIFAGNYNFLDSFSRLATVYEGGNDTVTILELNEQVLRLQTLDGDVLHLRKDR